MRAFRLAGPAALSDLVGDALVVEFGMAARLVERRVDDRVLDDDLTHGVSALAVWKSYTKGSPSAKRTVESILSELIETPEMGRRRPFEPVLKCGALGERPLSVTHWPLGG
jgi:hypothetical protein